MSFVPRPRVTHCPAKHDLHVHGRLNVAGSRNCAICERRSAREYRARTWARTHRAHHTVVDDKQPPPSIALVVWHLPTLRAAWTYHRTRAAAAAAAPVDGSPFSVVDTARKPWIVRPPLGRGAPLSSKELLRLQAQAAAVNDRQMRRHPQGLPGRVRDAITDSELLDADPTASPQAKQSARALADALSAALAAEH
jgi:hypothetical protein